MFNKLFTYHRAGGAVIGLELRSFDHNFFDDNQDFSEYPDQQDCFSQQSKGGTEIPRCSVRIF